MFQNIVVPVDLSDRARESIRTALELAAPTGGRVTLLHVIETLRDVPFEELEAFYLELRRRAQLHLEKWQAEFATRGTVWNEIRFGSRATEILRFVEQHSADLIVLASHKLDPERPRESFGTLSHQIGLLAACPVLLVR